MSKKQVFIIFIIQNKKCTYSKYIRIIRKCLFRTFPHKQPCLINARCCVLVILYGFTIDFCHGQLGALLVTEAKILRVPRDTLWFPIPGKLLAFTQAAPRSDAHNDNPSLLGITSLDYNNHNT